MMSYSNPKDRLACFKRGRKEQDQTAPVQHFRTSLYIRLFNAKIRDVSHLKEMGLYISDFNMYDRSREIILKDDIRSDQLLQLFKRQHGESKQLEKSMRKVAKARRITDQLLYQCIPKAVARKLRKDVAPLDTIESFDSVSICFTKIVDFTEKCGQIEVQQFINLLNKMYTLYDALTESHNVYKVETVGDIYMLVSGAPHRTRLHSAHIVETAFDFVTQTSQQSLKWPATNDDDAGLGEPLNLLVGCHTGPIVAGVVGYKTPRYCLFGDTVNTASRMMSNGLPNKIHVSQDFADNLKEFPYKVELRGNLEVKGKGKMQTFIVADRKADFSYHHEQHKQSDIDIDDGQYKVMSVKYHFADLLETDTENKDNGLSSSLTTDDESNNRDYDASSSLSLSLRPIDNPSQQKNESAEKLLPPSQDELKSPSSNQLAPKRQRKLGRGAHISVGECPMTLQGKVGHRLSRQYQVESGDQPLPSPSKSAGKSGESKSGNRRHQVPSSGRSKRDVVKFAAEEAQLIEYQQEADSSHSIETPPKRDAIVRPSCLKGASRKERQPDTNVSTIKKPVLVSSPVDPMASSDVIAHDKQ